MTIKRSIKPLGLLLAGIGSIVGSGWLFGPYYAAQMAGPSAILSWILGGGMMLIINLTFAELGAAFPESGGMVQYAQYSHGTLMSFLIGWMVWISSVAVAPVETLGLIQYASNYIPQLMVQSGGSQVLSLLGIFASAFIMIIMCLLNYLGAEFFSKSNNVITVLKLMVPVTTLVILIISNFHGDNFYVKGVFPFGWHGVLSVLPLGGVIYSFIGANTILQLSGEALNPQRSIPFALLGSVIFCIALYVLLQIAFIGSLNNSMLSLGWSSLHFIGDAGPFAGILTSMGLAWFVTILYSDAFISPFGTGYIFTASTARVNYGLSKIGFFPQHQQKFSNNSVPVYGLVLNYLTGLLLFLPFPGWQSMVSFIISCFIFSYIIGPIALIPLRKQFPEIKRPFNLPYAKTICLLAFYFCNLLIYWTGWYIVSRMMGMLLVGSIIFGVYYIRNKNIILNKQTLSVWWLSPYLISLSLISYYGSFGGGRGYISFGYDFLLIFILSCCAFHSAIQIPNKTDFTGGQNRKVLYGVRGISNSKTYSFPLLNRWMVRH